LARKLPQVRPWEYRFAPHTDLAQVNEEISMPNSFVHETGTRPDSRREAALNWLALGLLLAAWNASDSDKGTGAGTGTSAGMGTSTSIRRRPDALRGYDTVSVRAANRVNAKGW
jgi:hypothetical protein